MKIKTYKFLEDSRVIQLDKTMVDLKDISAIQVIEFDSIYYKTNLILKSKRYITVLLKSGMLEELQKDFLAERVRRVNAGNFIKSNTGVEKKIADNKVRSNVWWNWFK
jgi:hypothetical protein